MAKGYTILMKKYEEELNEQVKREKIAEETKESYLRDANIIFESLLAAFTKEGLEAVVKIRKFRGSPITVIKDLKDIVDKRKR
ncbi:hypothetical protein KAW50_01165 [candidate division WOR-3 bacterium]|nr:hypothetical protein [candidate division WOR-3 bacterium]